MKLFTLQNTHSGWFRHMHGGGDTSQPNLAVRLTDNKADAWLADAFRDYRKLPVAELRREAAKLNRA